MSGCGGSSNSGSGSKRDSIPSVKEVNDISIGQIISDVGAIILSNIEASAGICIGMGGSVEKGILSAEAIVRMDLVGVRFKDGQIEFGHNGASGFNFSASPFYIGPQHSTFETFSGERTVEEPTYADVGYSDGSAAAFIIGYHYDVNISYSGIVIGLYEYFKSLE